MTRTPDSNLEPATEPERLRRWLLAARQGNAWAGAQMWHAVSPRLLPYARAILSSRDGHDAQDCLQAALASLSRLTPERAAELRDVFAFLVTCVRREALDMKRSQRNATRHVRIVASRDGSDALLDVPGKLLGAQEALLEMLWKLDEDQREIIVLRHVVGLSFDQLALALDAPRSTIFSRYKAALGILVRLQESGQARQDTARGQMDAARATGPLPLAGGAAC